MFDIYGFGFDPFPHTTILQQTTWNTSRQKYEKSLKRTKAYFMEKETNMVKGEIANYEQFSLVPKYSQKSFAADASKCVWMWERVEYFNLMVKMIPHEC